MCKNTCMEHGYQLELYLSFDCLVQLYNKVQQTKSRTAGEGCIVIQVKRVPSLLFNQPLIGSRKHFPLKKKAVM